MADFTTTTNLSLKKPAVGGSSDKWGEYLNSDLDTIDTEIQSLKTASTSRSLESLSNVLDLTPTTGQLLQYDTANWKAATVTIPEDIEDLSNVTVSSPTDGQVLAYSASNSRWENQTAGAATIPDGTITTAKLSTSLQGQVNLILQTTGTPTDDQILRYNATTSRWEFQDLPGGTISALSDTDVSGISNKDVLVYNSTSGDWVSRPLAIADVTGLQTELDAKLESSDLSVSSLTDTTITTTADNSVLVYDSSDSKWKNEAPSTARTSLGLAIGTDVQAYDAGLQSISGLTTAADKMLYTTASDIYAVADLTAAGRALLDDADADAQRTTLGLGVLATQSTITESQISDLGSYITASSTDTLTNKSGAISQWTNDSGYLTAETNDLSTSVTWVNVPDVNITQSSVTQHQAALTITESQISDLQSYLTAETNDLGSAVTGTLPIANGGTGETTAAAARIALLPTLGTAGQVLAVNTGTTDVEWVDAASGGGSGTVTSVAISGSDGIEVDSGSPITTSGTIALGINAATLSSHLSLGTAATTASTDYATAAQGSLAASAVQPGDDADTLGSGAATDGYVLTADGAGNTAWEAVSGGAASLPIDLLSSGASIRKSDGTTAILSESGGAVTLENASLGDTVLMPDNSNNVSTAPGIRFEADTDTGIGLASAGNLAIITGGTEHMRIDSSGNVGIGASSPSGKLNLSDSTSCQLNINSSAAGSTRQILFSTGTNTQEAAISANNSTGEFKFESGRPGTGAYFQTFYTNNAERMRIDSSGNALIGYTSSNGSYKLQVNSQIFATSATIATSDGRYKENVTSLDGALNLVAQLNPVQFTWKEHPVHEFDRAQPTVGFIAQEVQEVLKDTPYVNSIIKANECTIEDAVYETIEISPAIPEELDENGEIITPAQEAVTEQRLVSEAITEEFLGIAEGNLIALLTKALQEANAKIDALETRIQALEV